MLGDFGSEASNNNSMKSNDMETHEAQFEYNDSMEESKRRMVVDDQEQTTQLLKNKDSKELLGVVEM